MKSICVSRILQNDRHAISLTYSFDDAQLAATIANYGILPKLYSGKSVGSINDLSKQLLRMRTDAFLFFLSEESIAIIREICLELRAIRPHVIFFFWVSGNDLAKELLCEISEFGEILPHSNIELTSYKLALGVNGDTVVNSEIVSLKSPYVSKLLSISDLFRFGIKISKKSRLFEEELKWITEQYFDKTQCLAFFTGDADESQILQLINLLKINIILNPIELHINADKCTEKLGKILQDVYIVNLIIAGHKRELHESFSATGRKISFLDDLSTTKNNRKTYGKNGIIALYSGGYFDDNKIASIKHLEIPFSLKDSLKSNAYKWASSNMDLLSAAVIRGTPAQINLSVNHFSDRKSADWPIHTYEISEEKEKNQQVVYFDGNINSSERIRRFSFSRIFDKQEISDDTNFISIKEADDLIELEKRLNIFHSKGELYAFAHMTYLENACRWGRLGSCKLPLLRRVEILENGQLRSCRDAGVIGTIGDKFEDIQININHKQQLESVRRGCAVCPVQSECSQCIELPALFEGKYCEIRKKYPHTTLYFELIYAINTFVSLLKLSKEKFRLIKVSYHGLPAFEKFKLSSSQEPLKRPILLNIDGHFLVWWRGTTKPIRISAPLALIAEGKWSNVANNEIHGIM